jgi:hypothetical protein
MIHQAQFSQVTTEQLLKEYCDAAVVHRQASKAGKYKKANPAAELIASIVRELRSRGPAAHAELLELLNDERVEVRGWAAGHCLEIAPQRAEKVLESIATGPKSLEEFSAQMILREWRAGRFKFP